MSSLYTDTIRKTGGTAGTDIKVNNSSTYVDGSNKSTNMIKAITKGWINYDYTAQNTRGSLNISSVTEEAAGDTTFTHTNAFSSEGYCTNCTGGGHDSTDGHWDYVLGNYNQTTTASRIRGLSVNYSSSLAEVKGGSISWRGDLA